MAAQGRLRQIKPQFAGTAQSSARTMDIFAHALWAGAGVMLARRHGSKVAPRTKTRLKAAATAHMELIEVSPERVKKYFQDPRVAYAAS